MFDAIAEDQMDDVPEGAPQDCCLSAQESKLTFLLTQSGDPDSTECLEKLDRAADDLFRKSKPYKIL